MADIETEDPGVRYTSDDGDVGAIVSILLDVLERDRAANPGERLDAIGIHHSVFDALYLLICGALVPNRNAIAARRRVGDDFELVWIYPELEVTHPNEVQCGRRRMT